MIQGRFLTAFIVVMVAIGALAGLVFSDAASAQQRARVGGNALKVSPVRTDVSLDPGAQKTIQILITNVTDVRTTLHPAINDFTASGAEDGKPSVILDENQYAPSHSLKQFVPKLADFSIGPNETKAINVTINVPKDAAGGGYFGAVRFYPAALPGQSTENVNLNLSASVGSLVLLKVNGDIREEMNVKSLDVRKGDKPGSFFTSPKDLKAVVRFENTGNVQLEPFGKMQLKRFGKEVGGYEINQRGPALVQGSVLPESIRRFSVDLKNLSSFGKYTVEGNFGYGANGQLITAKTTFYVVPVLLILLGVVALLVLLFLIFVLPRMIRSYNKRIIRKASRRR